MSQETEHVAMSALKRGWTFYYFSFTVLNNNISPPHTNSNTFTIWNDCTEDGNHNSAVHLVLWFKTSVSWVLWWASLSNHKATYWGRDEHPFCWKENTNKGSCKTVSVHYFVTYAYNISCCLLASLLKRNNSAPLWAPHPHRQIKNHWPALSY